MNAGVKILLIVSSVAVLGFIGYYIYKKSAKATESQYGQALDLTKAAGMDIMETEGENTVVLKQAFLTGLTKKEADKLIETLKVFGTFDTSDDAPPSAHSTLESIWNKVLSKFVELKRTQKVIRNA